MSSLKGGEMCFSYSNNADIQAEKINHLKQQYETIADFGLVATVMLRSILQNISADLIM